MEDPPCPTAPVNGIRKWLSENAVVREGKIAAPFAGGGENCIAKRGHKRRYARFSHAGGRCSAFRNVDVGLNRDLVDSGHGIVIEIRLLDYSVLGGDLAAAHDARAK